MKKKEPYVKIQRRYLCYDIVVVMLFFLQQNPLYVMSSSVCINYCLNRSTYTSVHTVIIIIY